ncbi:hypothetical protein O6H91_08G102300 [Diphasiastrum complanatum]|uniref:Uncharacterized protein n=1 Tax=Diphasiastrum complanatum TaxID=34168 RepID=A0ACC2D0H1_DIPCM|nr:hypothetical protein O6H91_08G102300 [Diphasiastrum complanatum]
MAAATLNPPSSSSSSTLLPYRSPASHTQTARAHSSGCSIAFPYALSELQDRRLSTASLLILGRGLGSLTWRLQARHSGRPAAKSRKAEKFERAFAEHFTGDDDLEDEEEEDNNLDLLFQLVRNFIRKISTKATRIARAILPPALSTDLVAFSVNGVVLLSVLWISKAFLEVICAVGNAIFFALLVIRSIWSVLTYIQSQNRQFEVNNTGADGGGNQRPDFMVPGAPA